MSFYSLPRIGDRAPEFKAITTNGHVIEFPLNCIGRWVVLFSLPANLSLVSTSELLIVGAMYEKFLNANCMLIGISVESVAIDIFRLFNVPFPILDDSLSLNIVRRYGMIESYRNGSLIPAVYFIDPIGIIRAFFFYPFNFSRNFEEIYRVLIGMQASSLQTENSLFSWQPRSEPVLLNSTLFTNVLSPTTTTTTTAALTTVVAAVATQSLSTDGKLTEMVRVAFRRQ